MDRKDHLHFWGKAGGDRLGEPAWHPLAYHCLDVAAVADRLLGETPGRLSGLANLLGTSPENAKRMLLALIALHDVGKFSSWFQSKSEPAYACSAQDLLGPYQPPPASRHDVDGYTLGCEINLVTSFEPAFAQWAFTDVLCLWRAIAGHHGQPANDAMPKPLHGGFKKQSLAAAEAFVKDIGVLFGPFEQVTQPSEAALAAVSWQLAGLTVVADWIGSNRSWFPYRAPDQSLEDYWQLAKGKAEDAVRLAAMAAPTLNSHLDATALLPEIADRLSPLQKCVAEIPLPDGPVLTLVEDVTGSGKTEAALLLAARLMAKGQAGGIFFALPTMATANAMYDRLEKTYTRFFKDTYQASLVLAHGRRSLNSTFTDSILAVSGADEGYEEAGGTHCAKWIADDRRKCFLADVGVGTIDQALLGVLPSRHQSLRLWGLANRVLVIDEAHAYDAYMSREMETLLEFHAGLGGSAIVLSATLPALLKSRLTKAFQKGLGSARSLTEDIRCAYPLLTIASPAGITHEPVPTRDDRHRRLNVQRTEQEEAVLDYIADMARKGAAVAWIRNAVDDVMEAATKLEERGVRPTILHARFAMGDRLDIEKHVTDALGRQGGTGGRRGMVVVGTQILEQSLDYDVDAMVSDLAPIDLLIQRAGRLWRHTDRDDRPVREPEFVVFAPDPGSVTDSDWYRQVSSRAAAVYGHHGIVWRSAKVLFEAGAIATPEGVRDLVEAVYDETRAADLPEPLTKASRDAEGGQSAARSIAGASLLDFGKGYGGDVNVWQNDQTVATRLGQPVTTFRLGRMRDGRIVPWCHDDHIMRAWALSEVSVSRKKADGVPEQETAIAKLIGAAKISWPEWEREMPLLVLDEVNDCWTGAVSLDGQTRTARYDRAKGFRLVI